MQAKKRRQSRDFFGGPTVIKSVKRILAYLLDSRGGKKAVSCDNGEFYIFTFGFHAVVR